MYAWVGAVLRRLLQSDIASIIQAPHYATVCRTHFRVDAKWGFHCGENYVHAQILGAYIYCYNYVRAQSIKQLIKISSGYLYLDNDADWLLVLHQVTPTEMELFSSCFQHSATFY